VTRRARWVTLRARWMTLRARWVTLRARWVTLRARWVTLRARWVTLRAPWVLVQVSDTETVGQIKPRIQARLGISDDEFAKWKFAQCSMSRPEYLEDADVIGDRFISSARREWGGPLPARSLSPSPSRVMHPLHLNPESLRAKLEGWFGRGSGERCAEGDGTRGRLGFFVASRSGGVQPRLRARG
jgi:hypothetical protein